MDTNKTDLDKNIQIEEKTIRMRYAKGRSIKWIRSVLLHANDFWFVWALLAGLVLLALVLKLPTFWVTILELLFFLYIILKPMGAVYALVGASTSLQAFFINFILITMAFAGIYYGLFFKDAGICFQGEVAQIDYTIFKDHPDKNMLFLSDTTRTTYLEERNLDGKNVSEEVTQTKVETMRYQRITFSIVLENTLITSLTQDPSDLYYVISDLGESMNAISSDHQKTKLFSYTLLLHILISWLFLGVFISLVYSKFRYEA